MFISDHWTMSPMLILTQETDPGSLLRRRQISDPSVVKTSLSRPIRENSPRNCEGDLETSDRVIRGQISPAPFDIHLFLILQSNFKRSAYRPLRYSSVLYSTFEIKAQRSYLPEPMPRHRHNMIRNTIRMRCRAHQQPLSNILLWKSLPKRLDPSRILFRRMNF